MFEDRIYENLLKEKLERIDAGYDKREGAVIFDALAPNAAETAQVYAQMEWMLQQMFGDTADREYLIRIAQATRGITPNIATHAVLKGKFNIEITRGTRFSLDALNYYVSDFIEQNDGFFYYKMICETAGNIGNRNFGTLIPIEYVPGLTTCELTEVLIPGENEENTEVFRKRWKEAFQTKAFGGNKADYKEKICSIDGVGGCKVRRAETANGSATGNHVRCVIIAADYKPASQVLVDKVQQIMDPYGDMEGDGYAPIGHIIHIQSVVAVPVTISAQIVYDSGYSFSALRSYIEQAVDDYFNELAAAWEASGETPQVVRIAKIESAVLTITGILDITGTTLNGAAQNIILGTDEIAVRGEIDG